MNTVDTSVLAKVRQAIQAGATKLSLAGLPLARLPEELSKATTLRTLDLSGCMQLQDLQPLAKLTALRSLNLSGCEKLQDLQPLVKLSALRSLILRGCEKLQDLQPLVKLTALRSLDLSGCKKLQDLQPLAKLTALRSLDLSGCKKLRDLQPLAKLTALRSLDLGGCRQLQDLQPLAGLARLGSFQLLESVSFNCDPGAQPLASWGGLEALYCDHLMGPPSELGSREGNDNALPRIRAWQRDIAHGEAANSAVKVFLLGNGWVGKTQVARRLRDEPFDQSVPSTHGITLSAVQLAAARGGLPAVDAVVWDFGGQDIYLGTHALFLDERAIYVIAWTPAYENADETEREGMLTRNRPLAYWLEYARSLGGEQAPVIVVQTQCDGELQVRAPALPPDHGFARLRVTSCSAKQDDGMEGLQLELKSAARYQLERYGKVRLPASWVKITGKLRARADEKTLPRAEFERLCAKGHSAAVPGVVLEYLHRSGQVFYRQGVFDDAVVLDLGWALAGVYAVLNRRTALPEIRRSAGRFSPQVLAALAWRDYGEEEHRLFISLMEQCQICFQVAEDVYIAPALLPQQEAMKDAIEHVWRGGDPNAIARLDYAFLHEGVLRAMLCGIGRRAGVHAVYWAYGVCFYDDEHRSTARITSQLPAAHAGGQRGKITVEAAGGLALTLVEHLVESIRQVSIGRPPEVIWERGQPGGAPGKGEQSTTKRAAFSEVRPVEVPRLPGQPQPVYVSYAWGGESEALVDEIERRLPPTLELKRDKSELRPGDWISRFMQEIGRAQFVLVVLSDKYVRSVYCMRELLYLHHTSLGEKEAFLHKLVPLTLSDLKISRAKDRAGYIQFWKHEREETEAKFAGLDHVSFGGEDRTELLAILDFQHHVSDMLAWVGDTLMPRGAELHSKGIDAAIELLLQRANGAGR